MFEVFHGAKLGVHGLIVCNGIIRTQGALALLFSNLIHGHEPQHIHAQILEAGQLGLHTFERAFR